MTIVAAVKSRDGLVLGTDSMSQVVQLVQTPAGTVDTAFLKAYANATKLFQLGDFPIAIASWGAGNIGSRSIGGLVLDYGESLGSPPATMADTASGLMQFIGQVYDAAFGQVDIAQRPVLGFLLGGYSVGQPLPELWEVKFPVLNQQGDRQIILRPPDDFGANWRGIELPFTRLHFGYDPRILERLLAAGVDPNIIEQAVQPYVTPVIFDSMPIQDATEFTAYILRTTILFSTFEVGVPACGDPLQIAVVIRRKGFSWVNEPRFHV